MPMELRPVVRRLRLRRRRQIGGGVELELREGSLAGRPVVAITTGMGPRLAREAVSALLDAVDVDQVLVVGITGAVDNDTPVGTLIRPAAVVDGATGTEYTPEWRGSPGQGKLWTVDHLITDRALVAGLRDRGVVALDMETAAVAAVCEERGVRWSVFRVISDRASDGSVDEEVFAMSHQDGSFDYRAVARFLLRHPGRVPGLVRLARGANLATGRAADAAIEAVSV